MNELRGLDAWITGGRYSSEFLIVICSFCTDTTVVKSETEYGATYWSPEECKYCGEEFTDKTEYEEYYPEEKI